MPDPDAVVAIARQWLERAESDLAAARLVLDAGTIGPWVAAFHAQQAAEKAIKAILTRDQVDFPKTHDLGELRALVTTPHALPDGSQLARLNPYSVEARYPDLALGSAPTADEARGAIVLAERVVTGARRAIDERAVSDG